MDIFVIVILGVFILFAISMIIVSSIQIKKLNHESEKLFDKTIWKGFIKHINDFKYIGKSEIGKSEYDTNKICHSWYYGNYEIIVWIDKSTREIPFASIHTINSGDCVLSSFNRVKSKEMARKLIHNLWKEKKNVW